MLRSSNPCNYWNFCNHNKLQARQHQGRDFIFLLLEALGNYIQLDCLALCYSSNKVLSALAWGIADSFIIWKIKETMMENKKKFLMIWYFFSEIMVTNTIGSATMIWEKKKQKISNLFLFVLHVECNNMKHLALNLYTNYLLKKIYSKIFSYLSDMQVSSNH